MKQTYRSIKKYICLVQLICAVNYSVSNECYFRNTALQSEDFKLRSYAESPKRPNRPETVGIISEIIVNGAWLFPHQEYARQPHWYF